MREIGNINFRRKCLILFLVFSEKTARRWQNVRACFLKGSEEQAKRHFETRLHQVLEVCMLIKKLNKKLLNLTLFQ